MSHLICYLVGLLIGGMAISIHHSKDTKPIEQQSVTCEVYLHASDKEVHKYVGEIKK